jgi:hypothetical protein
MNVSGMHSACDDRPMLSAPGGGLLAWSACALSPTLTQADPSKLSRPPPVAVACCLGTTLNAPLPGVFSSDHQPVVLRVHDQVPTHKQTWVTVTCAGSYMCMGWSLQVESRG